LPLTSLCEQWVRFGFGNGLETAVAFAAVPRMTHLPLVPILGPFGGNQPIVAAHAVLPEAESIGYCGRHCVLPGFRLGLAQRGNSIMAVGFAICTKLSLSPSIARQFTVHGVLEILPSPHFQCTDVQSANAD